MPLTRPRLVAEEGDVTAGALKANDAYDLKLWEMPDGDLVLFMKLQFFFEDGDAASGKWTDVEKRKFMKDWTIAVNVAWSEAARLRRSARSPIPQLARERVA